MRKVTKDEQKLMTRVGQELLEIAGEKLRYRKNLTLTDCWDCV